MTTPRSTLGFIAIDVDGTLLIEKIDKNPYYGATHFAANLRPWLVDYLKAAQTEGLDIIILTARPRVLEPGIKAIQLGTKDTTTIVDELEQEGVHVRQVLRVTTKKKGGCMASLLEEYPEDAQGVLVEDQLKQTSSVHRLRQERLHAFDINSYRDLCQLYEFLESFSATNLPPHPDEIVRDMLSSNDTLRHFNETIAGLLEEQLGDEKSILEELVKDFAIRMYESQAVEYQPELDWINGVISTLNTLLSDDNALNHRAVKDACKGVFKLEQVKNIKPNSNTHQLLLSLFYSFHQTLTIESLQQIITQYSASGIPMHDFSNALRLHDKAQAISQFKQLFSQQLTALNDSETGKAFSSHVKSILAQVAQWQLLPEIEASTPRQGPGMFDSRSEALSVGSSSHAHSVRARRRS